ncbi:MAG: histone H3/H4 [Candidatus Nanohaloarchaea archaeon]|jgi:histone H3/H4
MEFSIRSMRQIFKSNTTKRVSEDAAKELGEFLDDWAEEVGEEADKVAQEKGRETVRAEDIREVLRNMKDRDVEHSLNV